MYSQELHITDLNIVSGKSFRELRSGRYQVLKLLVRSPSTTVSSAITTKSVRYYWELPRETSMKLSKKPQRFIEENFCSILEYILSDHFTIRSIKTKIHSQSNTVLASFHTKSVSTNLTLMNRLLHSQTSIRMYV